MACDVPHLCQFIPIQAEVNFNTVFSSNYCPVSAFRKKRQPYPTIKWDKVFKNRPSKICGRQPLKNFTWSILKNFVPNHSNLSFSNVFYFAMVFDNDVHKARFFVMPLFMPLYIFIPHAI